MIDDKVLPNGKRWIRVHVTPNVVDLRPNHEVIVAAVDDDNRSNILRVCLYPCLCVV